MSSLKKVLVIDCGANHVAAGFFSTSPRGIVLNHIEIETIGSDHANEQEWIHAVFLGLRAISKRRKLSGPAYVVAPGHLLLMKFLKIPHVGKSKRDQIIKFEAQQNIPYPLPEVVWDYEVLHDDGGEFEVALVAIKIEIIQSLCERINSLGMETEIVEPSSMAQLNAFVYSYPDVDEGALLLNIGAKSTNLLFIDKHGFFVRNVAIAGNTLTQAIADEMKISFAQAEDYKLQVFAGNGADEQVQKAVHGASDSFMRRFSMEVNRSIVNFRRQSGASQIQRVYLTGAGSLAPGMIENLSEKLTLNVEWYDSLRNVDVGSKLQPEQLDQIRFHVSEMIGAAQRSRPGAKTRLNLLPLELAKRVAFRKKKTFLAAGTAVLAVAAFLPIFNYQTRASVFREMAAEIEQELVPLRDFDSRIQENLRQVEEIERQAQNLNQLVGAKGSWIEFLNDIQARMIEVEDVWLDSFQLVSVRPGRQPGEEGVEAEEGGGGNVQIRVDLVGRLIDRNNPLSRVSPASQARVNQLFEGFRGSPYIAAVENERFDFNEPGVLRFNVTLVINPTQRI